MAVSRDPTDVEQLIASARKGDAAAFELIAVRYRRELGAHCYRMLGSPGDAEDAVQEALLAAWRGLPSFQGRSSLRSWLYRIATNVCLRLSAGRSTRLLSCDVGPSRRSASNLGEVVHGPVWLEPVAAGRRGRRARAGRKLPAARGRRARVRRSDQQGRYQPYQAEQAAKQQRQRPREPRLLADRGLRDLVQRKLNRYWSPEQIAGWLRALHPDDPTRTICHETIYRALIVPGARYLHSRYATKLRTGRKLRRSHASTRCHKDGAVRNMTMIKDRPVEVTDRVQPGHWESQWCCQAARGNGGGVSA